MFESGKTPKGLSTSLGKKWQRIQAIKNSKTKPRGQQDKQERGLNQMKATQSGEYKKRQRHKKKKLRKLDKLKEIVEARYTQNVQSTKDYQATITHKIVVWLGKN